MRKKVYVEADNIQRVRKNKEHLVPVKESENLEDSYIYQYRTLSSFWSIITSDSFWATNARFSNDYEEQLLGKRIMGEVIKGVSGADGEQILGDCYIVCFCDDGDKLSQWRGYAKKGVSIGFDFCNIRPFYIEKKNGDGFVCIYNSCYKVGYVDESTDRDKFIYQFKLRTGRDRNSIVLLKKQSPDIIPYVKHSGFCEEAESRLMFSDNDADLSQCIRYRESGGIEIPYIVVKAGGGVKKAKCIVRLQIIEKQKGIFKKKLLEELRKSRIKNVQIINCFDESAAETDDELCYGCTVRHGYVRRAIQETRQPCVFHKSASDRFYGKPLNEIYLSDAVNQEVVCDFLHNFINSHEEYKEYKIWCEGHLPIRKIRVGSMEGQDIVIESIKHYCNQKYWLRSVEVAGSKIPYRSKLI